MMGIHPEFTFKAVVGDIIYVKVSRMHGHHIIFDSVQRKICFYDVEFRFRKIM